MQFVVVCDFSIAFQMTHTKLCIVEPRSPAPPVLVIFIPTKYLSLSSSYHHQKWFLLV